MDRSVLHAVKTLNDNASRVSNEPVEQHVRLDGTDEGSIEAPVSSITSVSVPNNLKESIINDSAICDSRMENSTTHANPSLLNMTLDSSDVCTDRTSPERDRNNADDSCTILSNSHSGHEESSDIIEYIPFETKGYFHAEADYLSVIEVETSNSSDNVGKSGSPAGFESPDINLDIPLIQLDGYLNFNADDTLDSGEDTPNPDCTDSHIHDHNGYAKRQNDMPPNLSDSQDFEIIPQNVGTLVGDKLCDSEKYVTIDLLSEKDESDEPSGDSQILDNPDYLNCEDLNVTKSPLTGACNTESSSVNCIRHEEPINSADTTNSNDLNCLISEGVPSSVSNETGFSDASKCVTDDGDTTVSEVEKSSKLASNNKDSACFEDKTSSNSSLIEQKSKCSKSGPMSSVQSNLLRTVVSMNLVSKPSEMIDLVNDKDDLVDDSAIPEKLDVPAVSTKSSGRRFFTIKYLKEGATAHKLSSKERYVHEKKVVNSNGECLRSESDVTVTETSQMKKPSNPRMYRPPKVSRVSCSKEKNACSNVLSSSSDPLPEQNDILTQHQSSGAVLAHPVSKSSKDEVKDACATQLILSVNSEDSVQVPGSSGSYDYFDVKEVSSECHTYSESHKATADVTASFGNLKDDSGDGIPEHYNMAGSSCLPAVSKDSSGKSSIPNSFKEKDAEQEYSSSQKDAGRKECAEGDCDLSFSQVNLKSLVNLSTSESGSKCDAFFINKAAHEVSTEKNNSGSDSCDKSDDDEDLHLVYSSDEDCQKIDEGSSDDHGSLCTKASCHSKSEIHADKSRCPMCVNSPNACQYCAIVNGSPKVEMTRMSDAEKQPVLCVCHRRFIRGDPHALCRFCRTCSADCKECEIIRGDPVVQRRLQASEYRVRVRKRVCIVSSCLVPLISGDPHTMCVNCRKCPSNCKHCMPLPSSNSIKVSTSKRVELDSARGIKSSSSCLQSQSDATVLDAHESQAEKDTKVMENSCTSTSSDEENAFRSCKRKVESSESRVSTRSRSIEDRINAVKQIFSESKSFKCENEKIPLKCVTPVLKQMIVLSDTQSSVTLPSTKVRLDDSTPRISVFMRSPSKRKVKRVVPADEDLPLYLKMRIKSEKSSMETPVEADAKDEVKPGVVKYPPKSDEIVVIRSGGHSRGLAKHTSDEEPEYKVMKQSTGRRLSIDSKCEESETKMDNRNDITVLYCSDSKPLKKKPGHLDNDNSSSFSLRRSPRKSGNVACSSNVDIADARNVESGSIPDKSPKKLTESNKLPSESSKHISFKHKRKQQKLLLHQARLLQGCTPSLGASKKK